MRQQHGSRPQRAHLGPLQRPATCGPQRPVEPDEVVTVDLRQREIADERLDPAPDGGGVAVGGRRLQRSLLAHLAGRQPLVEMLAHSLIRAGHERPLVTSIVRSHRLGERRLSGLLGREATTGDRAPVAALARADRELPAPRACVRGDHLGAVGEPVPLAPADRRLVTPAGLVDRPLVRSRECAALHRLSSVLSAGRISPCCLRPGAGPRWPSSRARFTQRAAWPRDLRRSSRCTAAVGASPSASAAL